jgi:hypothetical protein
LQGFDGIFPTGFNAGAWRDAMLASLPTPGRPSRRVSDMVLRTFEYACAMRNLKTAAMLLAVLEDLHKRRVSRFGGDRRKGGGELSAAMARLDQVKAERAV